MGEVSLCDVASPSTVRFCWLIFHRPGVRGFDLVWVMTGGGPGGATETVSIYTYRTYMRYLDFGYGAGLVVITVAILTLVAAALYRLLVVRHENTF